MSELTEQQIIQLTEANFNEDVNSIIEVINHYINTVENILLTAHWHKKEECATVHNGTCRKGNIAEITKESLEVMRNYMHYLETECDQITIQ